MSTAKLTESSKAVMLLRKKMRNGEVTLADNAKAVWESEPIFMKHKLDNFRTKFNRLKAEEEQNDGKFLIKFSG